MPATLKPKRKAKPHPNANSLHVRVKESYREDDDEQIEIDEANHIIRNCKVIGNKGENFDRTYPQRVLEANIAKYEGRPVNINHIPSGVEHRDFNDRFGRIVNIRAGKKGGLRGDLDYNPTHEKAAKVLWFAKNNPKAFGLSPDQYIREADSNGNSLPSRTDYRGPRTVQDIIHVQLVDIVADPSTTNGIQEAIMDDQVIQADASPPAEMDSIGHLREHITQMLAEKIGGIEDLDMLRKFSVKIEKLLNAVGGDEAEEAEDEGEEEGAEKKAEEAMDMDEKACKEALAADTTPLGKAVAKLLDIQHVKESALRSELEEFRNKDKAVGLRADARKRCTDAKLPAFAITDLFIDELITRAPEAQNKLIQDRALIASNRGGAVSVAREAIERQTANDKLPDAPKLDEFMAQVRGQNY